MRRTVLPIAAILLTAACSSTPRPAATTADPAAPKAASSPSTAAPTRTPRSAAKAKPSPSKSKNCGTYRDVIIWYRVPGIPDSAQKVGSYNLATCETTFDELTKDSPTGDGYCTEAAWASDNPGYNADADSPRRPKHIQVSVGPAC
ncbi:hypothetical protein [Streptomyces sp. NPDC057403]|uniref:hypothetical protein n=1 Tax=Streptomyces sp. NPDC057403 TaxID=3346119 RepID=UPI00368F4C09